MLHRAPGLESGPRAKLGGRTCGLLWTVTTLDAMTVVWMIVMGEWLDTASPVTSVVTLGARPGTHLTRRGR